ncbi:hypothetical protein CEUSTIGMA_g8252.t1 [Chlamydomonas eustigma]|uniref:Oxidoreductase-like domain-containing protein n=1 Tax=Chlamydomonas eustigma TaxID=1157962 RepID=A0A250XCI7_9CHLO|nr:hypothetical protein CEUSTIGMA_g8252.t1 [Chlamydomonas eustigma]|eukprot:GAX80817.1 hypothetical protein CEUSTIGMA_g8252.t1 [Chlamydomonas eustigma]
MRFVPLNHLLQSQIYVKISRHCCFKPGRIHRAQPVEPGPEECCQNGCITCVWEVYREEMKKWESERVEDGLIGMETPDTGISAKLVDSGSVSLDAFLELERKLKQQR